MFFIPPIPIRQAATRFFVAFGFARGHAGADADVFIPADSGTYGNIFLRGGKNLFKVSVWGHMAAPCPSGCAQKAAAAALQMRAAAPERLRFTPCSHNFLDTIALTQRF